MIGNAITRWWTGSQYSHCELVIDGVCYSASFMDGGVRRKCIDIGSGRWDIVPIEVGIVDSALLLFANTVGSKYDWYGIFGSQLFNRRKHHHHRYFCSEWVAEALGLPHPESYTPHTLLAMVEFLNSGGWHGRSTRA